MPARIYRLALTLTALLPRLHWASRKRLLNGAVFLGVGSALGPAGSPANVRRPHYIVLAAVAVLLLAAPAAEARHIGPGTRAFALQRATEYWAKQGKQFCTPAVEQVRTSKTFAANPNWLAYVARNGPYAEGDPRCRIVVNYTKNWREEGRRLGVTPRAFVCALLVHETGHLVGYRHAVSGVMTATISDVPAGCMTPL